MTIPNSSKTKFTPEIRELLPLREHRCERCPNLVFGNQSHYQLHLRQRHKVVIAPEPSGKVTEFHCPVEKCIYHEAIKGARSFGSLRLLRQHYQKSHLEKKYKCQECGEKFLLQRHLEKHQCSEHKCPVCELTYNSKAGLRTHMRRKNHIVEEEESDKVAIPSLATWKRLNQQPKTLSGESDVLPAIEVSPETPVEEPEEHILCFLPIVDVEYRNTQLQSEKLDMETQTEEVDDLEEIKNEVLAPLLRDIQTQTPDTRGDIGTMTDEFPEELQPVEEQQLQQQQPNAGSVESSFPSYPENEPLFGLQTSAHMYTQTCDELFEELGLSHIQTQTHWPDGLYNTQHTQTCDEMLDELEFLENFQSTYTQTKWLDWQENGEEGS
ncbi:hypothetical protein KR038_007623 [Drosophila bunnanda]|nr:hypothetical protein KR038_007623 [Drosophila bunnanda]